ncbi:unnamed protein product [Clonostachys byssicola]|uniref:Methyltransferase type 11 domain-containing protein n=1 Tax=Clonostachys byssicola TaxID=160290 RepID=A0A9N9Y3M5_9HYPO|nr:unnamed protein product [Clonostachys byssicola]
MSISDQAKEDYMNHAEQYNKFEFKPAGILESELVKTAIGDVSGLLVLDLGGGAGVHAREAVDAGASRIDLVDITPTMLQVAEEVEKSLEREGRMRFFEADVSLPLDHLPLEPAYDLIMVNWVLDHVGSIQMLEGVWKNIEKYLKPGGRFLGTRVADPKTHCLQVGKYGYIYKNFRPIPGGLAYTVSIPGDPVWEYEAASMEASLCRSFEVERKYGFIDIEVIPFESAKTIQEDPDFWKLFLENPPFVVVKAIKKQ